MTFELTIDTRFHPIEKAAKLGYEQFVENLEKSFKYFGIGNLSPWGELSEEYREDWRLIAKAIINDGQRQVMPMRLTKLCACIGPQNSDPFCPCRMTNFKAVDGKYVKVAGHGINYNEEK